MVFPGVLLNYPAGRFRLLPMLTLLPGRVISGLTLYLAFITALILADDTLEEQRGTSFAFAY